MGPWRALFCSALTVATGCSFLVSTDGLTGTATVIVIGPEGGAETGGPAEASPGDAGVVEGGLDGDASPPPFCASQSPKPLFCADFDNAPLTDYGDIQGGTPTLDTMQWTSPARSMLAVVETAATDRYADIVHTYASTAVMIQSSFSVYFDQYDTFHDVELVTVRFMTSGTSRCAVDVAVRANEWTLDESCDGSGAVFSIVHRSSIFMKMNRWTQISFGADFGARTLSLTVDDQKPFAGVAMLDSLANGPPSFAMGVAYLQTAATRVSARFDDVVFDSH